MRLLIDEHLSPQLAAWCAEQRGIYAVSVLHIGLANAPDPTIWEYAHARDFVVVTTNARDFLRLLDPELHAGLIIIQESGLDREGQWERLTLALDLVQSQPT